MIYPVDSVIHLSNNPGQYNIFPSRRANVHLFFLQTQQVPNSPEETVVDGPLIVDPCEEEPSNPAIGLLKQFYESKLGALSIGLVVGSLAVFVALRIYKAAK